MKILIDCLNSLTRLSVCKSPSWTWPVTLSSAYMFFRLKSTSLSSLCGDNLLFSTTSHPTTLSVFVLIIEPKHWLDFRLCPHAQSNDKTAFCCISSKFLKQTFLEMFIITGLIFFKIL